MTKNTVKQLVASLIALSVVFILANCSSKEEKTTADNLPTTQTTTTTQVAQVDTANLGASSSARGR